MTNQRISCQHVTMHAGVYFLRQTPGGRVLIDKWYEIRKDMQARGFHDQDGLYKYLSVEKEVGSWALQCLLSCLTAVGRHL